MKSIIHMIGIGGIGMSALARHLLAEGHIVSGSDLAGSKITTQLTKEGANIIIGEHKAENIPEDCTEVVATTAVPVRAEISTPS